MTKKESDRLMDLLEANIKAMGDISVLLAKLINPAGSAPQKAPEPVKETAEVVDTPEEAPEAPEEKKIDINLCRKAIDAVTRKTDRETAEALLKKFGVETIPKLKKKDYPAFIDAAKAVILEAKAGEE